MIHGKNGWLVPAGSIDSLVVTMQEVLRASDEEIQELGEAARNRVVERHNIDIEAEKLARLFATTGFLASTWSREFG